MTPLWKRLGWFVLIWLGGVGLLTVVALIIRTWLGV
ncbi:DUF2474 family protein [Wenxinia saemankumensis]|uniref:DUF2474 domain-containing protein n=1 Tax=Wenxinia saemankumensis TaxID=1447782 RepID=A0A1M6AAW3_9RHOB|nr:DUF2474 family protein [Wenxinia saemankumensis]SHI33518.1 Protein of unknown function [Wenxinia saemankumensis]